MNKRVLPSLTCLAFLLAFSCVSMYAQETEEATVSAIDDEFAPQFRLGISGGLTKNFHSDMALHVIDDPSCPVFNSTASTWGRSFGLVSVYQYSAMFGVTAHLQHSTRPGVSVLTQPSTQILMPSSDPNEDPIIVEQSISASADISYNLFELGLMGTVELVSTKHAGLGLAFGGIIAHADLLTATVKQEMSSPENGRFLNPEGWPTSNEGRVIVFAKDEPVKNASSTRVSARTGAFVDLRFLSPLHITPGVYYDYGLTSVVKDSDWTLNSILFQLDVTMGL